MEATVSFFPIFPDSLKPTSGSMIVRVWTAAASGPVPDAARLNISLPSRKNGRFSGK